MLIRVGKEEGQAVLVGTLFAGALAALAPVARAADADARAATLIDTYLERSFAVFPTRATAAGRHDRDGEVEDLSPERRAAWTAFNRETAQEAAALLAAPDLGPEERLDLELLRREAEVQRFGFETLDRPGRDPLFWTGILGDAT
ncbi:MAG: hypothetical protein ACRD0X_04485, partial [Thermoanaerobaculia bacterium]